MSRSTVLARISALASVLVLAAACAPKDSQLQDSRGGNRGGGGNGGGGDVESVSFDGKEVDQVRHALLQVAEARRRMDIALDLQSRYKLTPNDTETYTQPECISMKRPLPDSSPTSKETKEEVTLVYSNCEEATKDTPQAKKTGRESIQLVYAEPVPNKNNGLTVFPLPVVVTVSSNDLLVKLTHKSDKPNFKRHNVATALPELNVVASKLVEDEKNVVYLVNLDSVVTYDVEIGKTLKNGVLKTSMKGAEFTVDKTTRKVVAIKMTKLSFAQVGQQAQKTDINSVASVANRQTFKSALELVAPSDKTLELPRNVCEAPGVKATVKKGDAEFEIQSANGQVSNGGEPKAARLCAEDRTTQNFVEELEALLY